MKLGFFRTYSPCLLSIETQNHSGDFGIGTAFHIGDGYLITARHVVEGRGITAITPARYGEISLESIQIIYPDNADIDLALMRSDFNLDSYMKLTNFHNVDPQEKVDHIAIGGHLDDWIDDGLVMTECVVLGYPPIPLSNRAELVAVSGEVNAVIDPYAGSPHPLFVLSPMARGGFSGGPVLTRNGFLLGVVTSSLVTDNRVAELGYGAALTVEPIWDLLHKHKIYPGSNGDFMREVYDPAVEFSASDTVYEPDF